MKEHLLKKTFLWASDDDGVEPGKNDFYKIEVDTIKSLDDNHCGDLGCTQCTRTLCKFKIVKFNQGDVLPWDVAEFECEEESFHDVKRAVLSILQNI